MCERNSGNQMLMERTNVPGERRLGWRLTTDQRGFVFWYSQNKFLVTQQFSCFQNNTWQNFIDFTYLKILVESFSGDKVEKDCLDPGILGAISD